MRVTLRALLLPGRWLCGLLGSATCQLLLGIASGLLNSLSLQSRLSCRFKPGLLCGQIRFSRLFLRASGLGLALRLGFLAGSQPLLFDGFFYALAGLLASLRSRC
jgi:hypothetical protein